MSPLFKGTPLNPTAPSIAWLETLLWGALYGGLCTLATLRLLEWLWQRDSGAWRNLLFVLIGSGVIVLITDVPGRLGLGLPGPGLRMLQVAAGPLAALLTLRSLSHWLGHAGQDAFSRLMLQGSSALMLALAAGLALGAWLLPPAHFRSLLIASVLCMTVAAAAGALLAWRAARQGDAQARVILLAIALLCPACTGLYLHGLAMPGLGPGSLLATVVLTLAYLALASTAGSLRQQELRRLSQLARQQSGIEPATQLPTGAHLLRKVDDLLWTASRRQAQVAVIGLYLDNLYEPMAESEDGQTRDAGHDCCEHQILIATAARTRRAAGFRCLMGIHHARCLVVVLLLDKGQQALHATLRRLRAYVAEPIELGLPGRPARRFTPRVSIGTAISPATGAWAAALLDQAELQARTQAPEPAQLVDTGF